MADKTPYCWAPWTALYYTSMGTVAPCCIWNGQSTIGRFNGTAKEYFDSNWLKEVKKNMIEHDMTMINETCQVCLVRESQNHGVSDRIRYNSKVDNGIDEPGSIGFLDYRPGNYCNLKCIMCGPYSSSAIAKEMEIELPDFDRTDILDSIDFSMLKSVSILGGEPSIDPRTFKFLEYIGNNHPSIEINTTTNATHIGKKWISLIRPLKQFRLALSVDGIENVNDYIRRASTWNNVRTNIDFYYSLVDDCSIQFTAQAINFAVIDKWLEFFIQYDNVNFYPVINPSALSIHAIPDEIRSDKIKWLETIDHKYARAALQLFKSMPFRHETLIEFQQHISNIDRKNNTNILDLGDEFKVIMNYE